MSGVRYRLFARWKNRRESPEACARRLAKMLKELSAAHVAFGPWFTKEKKEGQAKLPGQPLPANIDDLAATFAGATGRKDTGALWPELGYHVMMWSTLGSPLSVILTVWPGQYDDMRAMPNHVDLEFQPLESANEGLLTCRVLRSVLLSAVSAWEPDWGGVSNWEYWGVRFPPPQPLPNFLSGWMTYLSAPYARRIIPPPSAIAEPVAGGGILMIATNDPFTVDNPQHVAAADAIQACLEPLQSNPLLVARKN